MWRSCWMQQRRVLAFGLSNTRSTAQHATNRSLSFAGAELLQEEEERPRLQALRERLRREEDTPTVSLAKHKNKNKNTTAPTTITTTTPSYTVQEHPDDTKQQQDDIHDILQQLQHLPTPSSAILTDSFQRHHSYLRLSLVEHCNLRCRYCMPPEGVPLQPSENLLTRSELQRLTSVFCKHGVTKVRLTGGEPLLRPDLVDIVSDLSLLSELQQIGMTTNGITLKRHLPQLIEAGLTHVNISLDTLCEDKFQDLTRRKGLDKVLGAIEAACEQLPSGRVKINCVVMKGVNDNELADFCEFSSNYPVDVRFIEWMPFNDNGWNANRFVSYRDMLKSVAHLNLERVEDGPNDTTKWWKLPSAKEGRVGFITSMSNHFCGSCNRLRITADGQIKVCLFGATEVSLRDVLRSNVCTEQDLEKLIHYAVQRKAFALGGHGSAEGIALANDNRPMTLIGG